VADKCGSWPWCSAAPMPGGRFCEGHQVFLSGIRAQLQPRKYRDFKRPPISSSVTVTHTEPSPRKRSPKPKLGRPKKPKAEMPSAIYRSRIINALKDGPLWSVALAEACGTHTNCGTYGRVRRLMVQQGVIIEGAQRGRERPYSLAPRGGDNEVTCSCTPARAPVAEPVEPVSQHAQ
jgi:hypothetical protein